MNQEHDSEDFTKSFQGMTMSEQERALAAMPPEQRTRLETQLATGNKALSRSAEQISTAAVSHGGSIAAPVIPAPSFERYFAYLLEIFPLLALVFIPVVGALLATLYILFRDAIFKGQSVGKKILKLRVVSLGDQRPAGLRESALRNFPLAIGFFLPIIPVFGHILGGTFASIVFIIEAVLVYVNKDRRRMGDKFANTIVVRETSVAVQG